MSVTTARYSAGVLSRVWSARIPITAEAGAYAALFLGGFLLRFWDLGSRALHHDESIHAQWAWRLMQGDYTHSPIFHGPFYYHFQAAVFFVFGTGDYTSRVSAAIAGTAIILLPLLLRKRLGAAGTLAAVAFLALSPTLVYYSRFLREDIYMAFFVLLMVASMWRYLAEGRERWLIVLALAFVGGVTTKEGMFLTLAVFLVFLDLFVASDLARVSLTRLLPQSGEDASDAEDPGGELPALVAVEPSGPRLWLLVAAIAPFSVPIVAFWPFLGRLRTRMGWTSLPRSGDLLVLLGTLCLPLLTPIARTPLEALGIVDKDIPLADGAFTSRLDWDDHLLTNITGNDRVFLAGLFLFTTSAAAFVGLQWKPKIWGVCFLLVAAIYLTLMTTEWTNLDGLVSGPWGSIDYWAEEQSEGFRGDQPWYYYYLLFPAYEFLPLAIAAVGVFWAVFRGDAFSRFLVFWLAGQFAALSYGSEKMPWLNTHLAVPACLLAAWTVQRAWSAVPVESRKRVLPALAAAAGMAAGALLFVVYLPDGLGYHVARLVVIAIAAFGVTFAAAPFGRRAVPLVVVVALASALSFFSVRTMVDAAFVRGDVPKDMLIYTQSSPDIPDIMEDIERIADATGKGKYLPIAVDGRDSFAWPWAWYLRDYKCVAYPDLAGGVVGTSLCEGEDQPYAVVLVNRSSELAVQQWMDDNEPATYGAPFVYPHRWWFPETYKDAVQVGSNFSCTAQAGDCGPFRLGTWKEIVQGIFGGTWPATWYKYWRDHDPDLIAGATGERRCASCGSVDALAYFPAEYDRATGKYSPAIVEPPRPSVDAAGRPQFGGRGSQPGNLVRPSDIETDAEGNLYVIDQSRRVLTKYDAAGNVLASVDVRTAGDVAEESQPWGLAIAPDGRVVVADTFGWRLRVFDSTLHLEGVYGETPLLLPDQPPGILELYGPRDAAVDRSGQVWITDTGHDRILVFDLQGNPIRAIGSEGAGPGQFNEPVGISIAADGSIWIADAYNARVVALDSRGEFLGSFPVEGWGGADADDKPYIRALSDGRIALTLPVAGEVRIYTQEGVLEGAINPQDVPLERPYGVVEAAGGTLWVVEGGASRVRQFPLP